jgi:hypothetical protein
MASPSAPVLGNVGRRKVDDVSRPLDGVSTAAIKSDLYRFGDRPEPLISVRRAKIRTCLH